MYHNSHTHKREREQELVIAVGVHTCVYTLIRAHNTRDDLPKIVVPYSRSCLWSYISHISRFELECVKFKL